MDRLACISVPSLPLQLALRRFSPGFEGPVVLVREDKPSSPILQLNRAARTRGLRSGMRYSEGISLIGNLKAVVVSAREVALAREEIHDLLENWSPHIEACPFEQGSFWIGSSGLAGLYGSEAQWGAGIRRALGEKRYFAVVVVGLTRGGTYVAARARRRSAVIRTPEAEQRAWEAAPLSIFPLPLRQRRLLERLGVTTLAALAQISPEELARRFGSGLVHELRLWQSSANLPLQTVRKREPWTRILRLETPVGDYRALVALVEEPLKEGLQALQRRARRLTEFRLVFVLDSGGLVGEVLRPAEPTVQSALLMKLLELRLARTLFSTGVVEVRLGIEEEPEKIETGELFAVPVVREPRRGAEAFAWIRAQWGNAAVVRPVLADSHVPEQSYRWEPLDRPIVPRLSLTSPPFLAAVRRVGWDPLGGRSNPAGERLGGPYRLRVTSGMVVVDREYWFLCNGRFEVNWVSWDRLSLVPRWEGVVD